MRSISIADSATTQTHGHDRADPDQAELSPQPLRAPTGNLLCIMGGTLHAFVLGRSRHHHTEERETMPTAYVRQVSLKAALSDAEVAAFWQFTMAEVVPALQRVPGMRSVKVYSGAGGLRADIRYVFEMDDAGVYERLLATRDLQPLVAKTYAAWDMSTASQTFLREVTPELIRALSST